MNSTRSRPVARAQDRPKPAGIILPQDGAAAHTEVSVSENRRRRRWVRLDQAAAREFTEDLLRLHAAGDEASVAAAQAAARSPRHGEWLGGLVAEHAAGRRAVLRGTEKAPGLSPREREVLGRLAQGETDAAAARALGVAPRTVSKHVENILRKLGVETRTAAVARAAEAGRP